MNKESNNSCQRCGGAGKIPCPACSGSGKTERLYEDYGKKERKVVSCAGCHGTGSRTCGVCGGTGKK